MATYADVQLLNNSLEGLSQALLRRKIMEQQDSQFAAEQAGRNEDQAMRSEFQKWQMGRGTEQDALTKQKLDQDRQYKNQLVARKALEFDVKRGEDEMKRLFANGENELIERVVTPEISIFHKKDGSGIHVVNKGDPNGKLTEPQWATLAGLLPKLMEAKQLYEPGSKESVAMDSTINAIMNKVQSFDALSGKPIASPATSNQPSAPGPSAAPPAKPSLPGAGTTGSGNKFKIVGGKLPLGASAERSAPSRTPDSQPQTTNRNRVDSVSMGEDDLRVAQLQKQISELQAGTPSNNGLLAAGELQRATIERLQKEIEEIRRGRK